MTTFDDEFWRRWIGALQQLQADMRAALCSHMAEQSIEHLSRTVRDDDGDTVFGIDAHVETILLQTCEAWGRRQRLTLVAEGLPSGGVTFGGDTTSEGPPLRWLVDPIDGTRGLMFDKRSAWSLAAIAPDRGAETRLSDVVIAVMTELPTTRQATSDVLWAGRGRGAGGRRDDLVRKTATNLPLLPSRATNLRHGFATVSNFFQGGKELLARLEESILRRALGGWNPDKAEVYTDQYICSGGQLAELMLGRDRFVLDVRPLAHQKLGFSTTLACRPYDLATMLIAQEAGCIVCDPLGGPLDAPLDTTTNLAFAGYANPKLAQALIPIVREEIARHLG